MQIAAFIPTVNRADLIGGALASLFANYETFSSITVFDNGHQDLTHLCQQGAQVIESDTNLGCSGSWNRCFKLLADNDWVMAMSDDVVLSEKTVANLPALCEARRDKWLIRGPRSYSVFLLSREGLAAMEYAPGKYFDEEFWPGMYEDLDFEWRMHLKDPTKLAIHLLELEPAVFRRGSSMKKDPTLNRSKENRARFIEKWGSIRARNRYKLPFNGAKPWPPRQRELWEPSQ